MVLFDNYLEQKFPELQGYGQLRFNQLWLLGKIITDVV